MRPAKCGCWPSGHTDRAAGCLLYSRGNTWKILILCLARGRVISATAAHFQIFVVLCQDLDGVETAIRGKSGRVIGQCILAAQFFLNFREGVGYFPNLER